MRLVVASLVFAAVLAPSARAVPEDPEFNSPAGAQREASNFAKTRESANEQVSSPAFQQRLTEQSATNLADYAAFQAAHGLANAGNLCNHWQFTCAGDPFRYPGFDDFYVTEAVVTETLFYDRGCARISGRVWRPADAAAGADLPGVVITTGSVQAPEPLYWWFAQALVRDGYAVMTWDVRGQGRSDTQTPTGQQGGNSDPTVFWDGTVDAIDFFHSTPAEPYPHNVRCAVEAAASAPLPAAAPHNPHHGVLDRDRLGLAGHSLGARGVSVVQSMDPWEGQLSTENPVDAIVAWDSLSGGDDITPRVPAMGQTSEYGLFNVPFAAAPDPDGHSEAAAEWADAGVPVSQFTIRGSTHYEWSLIPSTPVANFSATSWDDWGRPMAEHFSLAWMDRWLKVVGEPGFDTADARLADDAPFCERYSFYFRSMRDLPTRQGGDEVSSDVRAACLAAAGTDGSGNGSGNGSSNGSGTPDSTDTTTSTTGSSMVGGSGTLPATGPTVPILPLAGVVALGCGLGVRRSATRAPRSRDRDRASARR